MKRASFPDSESIRTISMNCRTIRSDIGFLPSVVRPARP